MTVLIIIFGALTLVAGIVIIINPEFIFGYLRNNLDKLAVHILAVVIRLVIGVLLIDQSSISKFPYAIEIIGWLLLHPQFQEIVSLISSERLNIIIETNGTLIDEAMAKFLKDAQYVSFISVSLDGSTAETHDELRNVKGSYDLATAGIKNGLASIKR